MAHFRLVLGAGLPGPDTSTFSTTAVGHQCHLQSREARTTGSPRVRTYQLGGKCIHRGSRQLLPKKLEPLPLHMHQLSVQWVHVQSAASLYLDGGCICIGSARRQPLSLKMAPVDYGSSRRGRCNRPGGKIRWAEAMGAAGSEQVGYFILLKQNKAQNESKKAWCFILLQ